MGAAIVKLLAPYVMQIATGLIVLSVVTGGYFYIQHTGVIKERDADNARMAKELVESNKLYNDAIVENAEIKQKHQDILVGVLTNASNITNTLNSQRIADIAKLQQSSAKKGNSNTMPGKTDVPGCDPRPVGGTIEEIEKAYDQYELAELSEIVAKWIRGAATIVK